MLKLFNAFSLFSSNFYDSHLLNFFFSMWERGGGSSAKFLKIARWYLYSTNGA